MKNARKLLSLMVIGAICLGMMTGCSTRMGEHSNTYFSQLSNVIDTAMNSSRLEKEALAAAATTPTVDENALATPTNFTVAEDGTYSFDAVENAQYYYIYIYTDSVSVEATAQSDKIMADGSAIYTGNLNDLGTFAYHTWNIRVAAYPDYENTDYSASAEAKCDYKVSGAVEYGEPTIDFMWTVTSGELTIKIGEMDYSNSAYPTSIKLTLTNEADPADVVNMEIMDISDKSATVKTTDVKLDATYSISADFTWNEEYVSNPSHSIQGGEAKTSSTENLSSGEFYYQSDICKAFDFPHVQLNFDPINGGQAGIWYNDGSTSGGGSASSGNEEEDEDKDENVYYEATPKAAENGAKYSFDIVCTSPAGGITATPRLAPGGGSADRIFGTLDIYADGTFRMEIEYQYISTDRMNAAVYYVPGIECYGVYTENADGTLNLSYDHENARETKYDIVTELTGKAAQWAAEHPEETEPQDQGGMPGGEGMPGDEGMPGGEGAPEEQGGMPEGAPPA